MDQDCNELLEQFSRSVVRIQIYHMETKSHDPEDEGTWTPVTFIPGIVTMSGSDFCHIIASSRRFFFSNQSEYAYEVIFPAKTSIELDVETVLETDWLVAFFVGTTGKKVDAVQFNDGNASSRDKVWMFGYNHDSESLLDDGTITHVGDEDFTHDVPPNSMSFSGYPVFNMENKLVGVSYFDFGVTKAINVKQMTFLLSSLYDGMIGKPLVEIIEHIKVLGEANYRQLQDSI